METAIRNEDAAKEILEKGDETGKAHVRQKATQEADGIIFTLCHKLEASVTGNNFACKDWVDTLDGYIKDPRNRLMYSKITNYIFDKSDEQFTTISTNLEKVQEYADKELRENPEKGNLYKAIYKFYDHVNLANQQKTLLSQRKEDLQRNIKMEVEPRLAEVTKDMTTQLISLIAIFTALSFIVFGGISSLNSIFQSLQETMEEKNTVLPTLIVSTSWALCLMNLLFGFMYFVLRIINRGESMESRQYNVVQRYPVVFLCDFVLALLLAVFSAAWFAECNGIGKGVFDAVVKHSTITFWVFVVVFIVIFLLLAKILLCMYHAKGQKKHCLIVRTIAKFFCIQEKASE